MVHGRVVRQKRRLPTRRDLILGMFFKFMLFFPLNVTSFYNCMWLLKKAMFTFFFFFFTPTVSNSFFNGMFEILWFSLRIPFWILSLCSNNCLAKCDTLPSNTNPLSTVCIKWLASKLCCAVTSGTGLCVIYCSFAVLNCVVWIQKERQQTEYRV